VPEQASDQKAAQDEEHVDADETAVEQTTVIEHDGEDRDAA
jgi:hypothetical protein